jgi:hypothetical protein
MKAYDQGQRFKEMGETDLVSDFLTNPAQLTPANVDAARPNLANSTYLQLMGKATELQNNPKGVIEAQAVNEGIKFYANQAGIKSPDDGKANEADKQNYTDLTFKVQEDINAIKAANHGKATQDQVNKAIQNEVAQRTLAVPRGAFAGFFLGQNYPVQKPNYAIPAGTTSVYRGNDGLPHYTDGTNDLGVVK